MQRKIECMDSLETNEVDPWWKSSNVMKKTISRFHEITICEYECI